MSEGKADSRRTVQQLVRQIKEYLLKQYRKKIKQVILYGSHVRGEATEDSDIDVLVVVDDSLDPFEVRNSLSALLYDILLDTGELISVITIPEQLFRSYNSPFLLNVREEGIVA
jgi:predicted nucleotidyltransferase